MKIRKYFEGGALSIIGFLLSPLSWWNDLLINIPLAYGFGWLFSLINEKLFAPFMVIGYWLTNIIGLILLHKGVVKIASAKEKKYTKKDFVKDMAMSLLYTLIIVALIYFKVLKLPQDIFVK